LSALSKAYGVFPHSRAHFPSAHSTKKTARYTSDPVQVLQFVIDFRSDSTDGIRPEVTVSVP
jgi:hypothetical protein